MNEVVITPPAPATVARCKNCGAALAGRFCANCSQAADVHVPSTRELIHELLEGLTHSDSRLWLTLKYLWFSPGKLTTEFVAGRRIAYLPPFRLYLVLSIIFFLMASFLHTGSDEMIQFDAALAPAGTPQAGSHKAEPRITNCTDLSASITERPYWGKRFQHACEQVVRDKGETMLHVAIGTMSKAMFIFLPLIAFLHMLLYWRPRYRYAEHLLFFVHLHAFYFSIAILLIAAIETAQSWPKVAGASDVVQTLLGWALPVYTLIAMRRVFKRSWVGTVFKALALFFVYMVVFGMTVGAVFIYSALQL
jgi:hypothetical protein